LDGIVYGETGRDTFCIPSGARVTLGQEVRVIVAYLMRAPLVCTMISDCLRSKP
jgi:hypothetical protein